LRATLPQSIIDRLQQAAGGTLHQVKDNSFTDMIGRSP